MFNNVSNVCIVDSKEFVRRCVSNSFLKVNVDEILECVCEEIDTDKFESWFKFNLQTFISKTNQTSYFKKALTNEIQKGSFKVNHIEYLPSIQPFINALKDKGIVILADDSGYLSVLWEELFNKYKIDADAARKLNRRILEYMKPGQTFADYKELLKKSNTLKPYGIIWEEIDEKANQFNGNWNKMLDEMEMESAYD